MQIGTSKVLFWQYWPKYCFLDRDSFRYWKSIPWVTLRPQGHDHNSYRIFLIGQKPFFSKVLVFLRANAQKWFFFKITFRTCLLTSYYIKKSGSPKNLRYDPRTPYLYLKETQWLQSTPLYIWIQIKHWYMHFHEIFTLWIKRISCPLNFNLKTLNCSFFYNHYIYLTFLVFKSCKYVLSSFNIMQG